MEENDADVSIIAIHSGITKDMISKMPNDDDIWIVKMKADTDKGLNKSDDEIVDDNLNDDVDIYICNEFLVPSPVLQNKVETPVVTIEKIDDERKKVSIACQTDPVDFRSPPRKELEIVCDDDKSPGKESEFLFDDNESSGKGFEFSFDDDLSSEKEFKSSFDCNKSPEKEFEFSFDDNKSPKKEFEFSFDDNKSPQKDTDFSSDERNSLEKEADVVNFEKKSPVKQLDVSYKCDECCLVYKNLPLFIRHKQRHLKRQTYRCDSCHISFEKQATLKYHTIVKHGDIRDLMTEAQKNKMAESQSRRSKAERGRDRKLECEECHLRFWKQNDLTAHVEKIHCGQYEERTETGHTCRKCNESFTSQFNFLSHLDKHNFDLKFGCKELQCNECKLWFYTTIDLMIHLQKEHLNENVFRCPKDSKVFKDEKIYKKHMEAHKTTSFQCGQCNVTFTKRTDLLKHLESHPAFPCYICMQSFTSKVGLKVHKRSHKGRGNFKCPECEEEFSLKCNLKNHIKIHSKEKRFTCTVCNESFEGYSILAAHSRFHIGEKRFKCSKCDKKFESFKELNAHERTHTNEKFFECTECNVQFLREVELLKHAKEHPQLKYECNECNAKCTDLESYQQHVRLHQKRRKFNCNECEKKFIDANDYLNHLRTHMKRIKKEVANSDEGGFVQDEENEE